MNSIEKSKNSGENPKISKKKSKNRKFQKQNEEQTIKIVEKFTNGDCSSNNMNDETTLLHDKIEKNCHIKENGTKSSEKIELLNGLAETSHINSKSQPNGLEDSMNAIGNQKLSGGTTNKKSKKKSLNDIEKDFKELKIVEVKTTNDNNSLLDLNLEKDNFKLPLDEEQKSSSSNLNDSINCQKLNDINENHNDNNSHQNQQVEESNCSSSTNSNLCQTVDIPKEISSNSNAQSSDVASGLDLSNVVIEYKEYESELQMQDIMRLIQAELSEPYSIYTYRYFIYNWPNLCFLAAHGNEYVGAIVCKLDMHMHVVKRGYIAMLAVKKEYRKLKIGTNLVQKAIEAMLADDADEVVLETEMKNVPALRLYENLGFVRDKRLFRYYLNGVDALRLKLWFR